MANNNPPFKRHTFLGQSNWAEGPTKPPKTKKQWASIYATGGGATVLKTETTNDDLSTSSAFSGFHRVNAF